jgi:hypothetical protein
VGDEAVRGMFGAPQGRVSSGGLPMSVERMAVERYGHSVESGSSFVDSTSG